MENLTKKQKDLLIFLMNKNYKLVIIKNLLRKDVDYILNNKKVDKNLKIIINNLINKKFIVEEKNNLKINYDKLQVRNIYQKLLLSNSQIYSRLFSRKELYNYLMSNDYLNDRGNTDFHYIDIDDLSRDFQGKYYICLFYKKELCGITMIEDFRDSGYYIKYNNSFITCISTLSIRNDLKGKGLSKYLLAHTFKNIPNSKLVYITKLSREAQKVSLDKTIKKLYTNKLINNINNLNNIQKIKIKD